jgi:adenylylsulfate kinase
LPFGGNELRDGRPETFGLRPLRVGPSPAAGAGCSRSVTLAAMTDNVVWHAGSVTPEDRSELLGHRSALVWLTGLSGSGKSSVARKVEGALHQRGALAYVLDGDNLRHGLNADLGFSMADRAENIRRTGEVARLLVDAGAIVLSALISPLRADRDRLRAALPAQFIEVHVATPLAICEARDPKGLWKKARAGEIRDFTGLDSPYEAPEHPELRIGEQQVPLEENAAKVIELLIARGVIKAG